MIRNLFLFCCTLDIYYCMKIIETTNKPDIREKAIEHGVSYLVNEELIMLIIGSGTKDLPVNVMARKMVEVIQDVDVDKAVASLLKIKGVGESKALAVAAAIELGRRRNEHLKAHINSPASIIPFVRNYSVSKKEHFIVVTLNGGHEIIQIHVVSVGTLNKTLIHPREIFTEAFKENAAAIILCHNHPSGNCNPSADDIDSTRILVQSSKILGIPILDHIIIDSENYFSFAENQLIFDED